MPLPPGTILGTYEIVALLGTGGMGEVYQAKDPRLDRLVAIKVLPETFARDPDRLRRFQQEARTLSALAHPNTVTIHGFGQHQGAPYLVMECLEGETLRDRLEGRSLSVRRAVDIALQASRGLAAAHEKGIVHRDLKPANLFLCRDGRVKILDFGLAKRLPPQPSQDPQPPASSPHLPSAAARTEAGIVLGTLGYMSPEQVQGKAVDARSDLFSLGVVLWEMLTGVPPFQRDSRIETLHAILKDDLPDLGTDPRIPTALVRILDLCLAKEPEARFHSAHDLSFALEAVLAAEPGTARPPTRTRKAGASLALWSAAALGLLLVGGLGAWRLLHPLPAPTFHRLTYGDGRVASARFTPSGQEILLSANWEDHATYQLFHLKLAPQELSSVGVKDALLEGISPQGEVVLALGLRSYAFFGLSGALGTARVDALAPKSLGGRVLGADLSPQGLLAVARQEDSGLFTLQCPPGRVRVSNGSDFTDLRFSPDGRRLACIERPLRGDSAGLVGLLDLESGRYARLTGPFGHILGLAWRGSDIWFTAARTSGDKVLLAVQPGRNERTVFRSPVDLTLLDIAPDGRILLAAEALSSRVYLARDRPPSLREMAEGFIPVPLGLSPDGSRFLCLSQTTMESPLAYDFYLKSVGGGPPMHLGRAAFGMALSPDGSKVVCLRGNPLHPVVIPLDQGEVVELPSQGLVEYESPPFLQWTRDGRAFLLQGRRAGAEMRTYLQEVDGGALQDIGPRTGPLPLLAPDGRRMLALLQGQLRLLDLKHPLRPPHKVQGLDQLFSETLWTMGWDAEGKRLLVAEMVPGGIRIVRVDPRQGTRSEWKRFHTADTPLRAFGSPCYLTPDGRTLLFSNLTWSSSLYLVEGLR